MRCIFALILCLLAGCQVSPQRNGVEIGAAELDITPPIGFRMGGYFEERISTGAHDPLQAKAIVLRQGQTTVALVFCDLLGLSLNVTTNARALASEKTAIPITNILIAATHTHTGPLFDDVRGDYLHQAALEKFGTDTNQTVDYPAFLVGQLAKLVATAQIRLQPGQLQAGFTRQEGLTFNRRYWMKDGTVRFNPGQLNPDIVRPAGPTDPSVDFLLARDGGGQEPFAGVTVFAMHSDTIGGTIFSADYEYGVQQTLRAAFGPNFISAFGLGACGDLNQINVNEKERTSGFDIAERIGRTLGEAVLRATPNAREIRHPDLAVRDAPLQAPLQEVTTAQVAKAHALMDRMNDPRLAFLARVEMVKTLDLERRGPTWPMEIQVIRLDAETAMVCLPGEIFAELGLDIKRASPFKHTIVLTLSNDRPSYVPTRKAFKEGSYEVSNARVQPGVGETLVETSLRLLRELKKP